MKKFLLALTACIVVVGIADESLGIGRRRLSRRQCPPVCAPKTNGCYGRPCVCPKEEVMSYWTGSAWNSLYIVDFYDDDCGCDGGACVGQDVSYITGRNVRINQECTVDCPCDSSSSFPLKEGPTWGLHRRVDYRHVPGDEDPNDGYKNPFLPLAGTTALTSAGTPRPISFEKEDGTCVRAKVFHYLVPEHDGRPPRLASFGFETDPGNTPPSDKKDIVTYASGRVQKRDPSGLGEDLYLVTIESIEYAIVVY